MPKLAEYNPILHRVEDEYEKTMSDRYLSSYKICNNLKISTIFSTYRTKIAI